MLGKVLAILTLLLFFYSCNLSTLTKEDDTDQQDQQDQLEILGTWSDQYGEITFTTDTYSSTYTTGDIVKYENEIFNGSEDSVGDCGYMVVLLTEAYSGVGQYTVVRWFNLETIDNVTTVQISEGYNANGYFDTPEEAEAGMTDANSCFTFNSTVTKQ